MIMFRVYTVKLTLPKYAYIRVYARVNDEKRFLLHLYGVIRRKQRARAR